MAGGRLAAELIINTAQASQALAAFGQNLNGIKRQLDTLSQAGTAIGNKSFGVGPGGLGTTGTGAGITSKISTLSNEYVKLGNTIKTVSQLTSSFIDAQGNFSNLVQGTTTAYAGDVERILRAQTAIAAASAKEQPILENKKKTLDQIDKLYEKQTKAANKQLSNAQANQVTAQGRLAAVAQARSAADQAVLAAQQNQSARQAAYTAARSSLTATQASFNMGFANQGQLNKAVGAEQKAFWELNQANSALAAATASKTGVVNQTAAELKSASKQLATAIASEAAATSKAAAAATTRSQSRVYAGNTTATALKAAGVDPKSMAALQGELFAARTAGPQLPSTISYLADKSPALLNQLERQGLGQPGGMPIGAFGKGVSRNSADYVQNLISQDAYEGINIQKDLVRQVTRVSGSFKDGKGIIQSFNAEFDKSGKVITRFGSQMSGIGSIFSSLKRDFQKVIEFAIATTVVFGALRYAMQEVGNVIELDKSIRQLSITSNQTRSETMGLFNDLAEVAIATATPLQEMVKAADDFALATRKAGQSTDEWNRQIISLAQSVGILTNLAGIDTVRATDLLVSTMKQLGLEADTLPGILNKITAVAGGQSGAIADVITGLGNMAEASKQAGLTIDETIGAVQALSQATSKSPEQVATAFKNLVGSLSGPAGIKALKEFDIALRNSDGSLRNILDVYGEIQTKIKQGIIPEAEVQGLIRAIAGGPRRAPDAAALLSVIDDIEEAAKRSAGATNDAFLANAKALDTVQAKMVQLQTRIDKFAVSKFANVIKQVSEGLLDFINILLTAFEAIPSQMIVLAIQFTALAATIKLSMTVGKLFLGTIINTTMGFTTLAANIIAATAALLGYNRAASSTPPGPVPTGPGTVIPLGPSQPISRREMLKGLGKTALLGGAVGGITAAASLSSGADLMQSAGMGLQSAGLALLMAAPIPHAKALGGVLAIVGTGMTFLTGETKKANVAMDENAEAVLNAYTAFREATNVMDELNTRLAETDEIINDIKGIPDAKKTEEDITRLGNAQAEYAELTMRAVDANNALNSSYNTLAAEIKNFPTYQIDAAKNGLLKDEELQKLIKDLSIKFIQQTSPDFVPAADWELPGPVNTTARSVLEGPSTASFTVQKQGVEGTSGQSFTWIEEVRIDLEKLGDDSNNVARLFDENGKIIANSFVPTPKNLDLVKKGLEGARDAIDPEKYKIMATSLNELAASVNPLTQLQNVITQYTGYLQALQIADPFIKPEDIARGYEMLAIYQALVLLGEMPDSYVPDPRVSPGREGASLGLHEKEREAAKKVVRDFNFDESRNFRLDPRTKEEWLEYANAVLILRGEFEKAGDAAQVFELAKEMATNAGEEVNGLTESLVKLGEVTDEVAEKARAAFGEFIDKEIASLAEESAQLRADKMGGLIKTDEFVKGNADIEATIRLLRDLRTVYDELAGTTEGLEELPMSTVFDTSSIEEFIADIEKIPGLQDASSLTTQQLIERMLTLADTYGLTGAQVDLLGIKMNKLFGALQTISKYRAKIGVGVDVDVSALIKLYKALNKGVPVVNPATGFTTGYTGGGAYSGIIRDLEAAQNTISRVGSSVGDIYRSGSGSPSSSSGSKSKSGAAKKSLDYGEIDLPEELSGLSNQDSLIAQAIRNARALQKKIPGAAKEGKDDVVTILDGMKKLEVVRGIREDLLRRALEELADIEKKRLENELKVSTISRIRVGAGSFAAIANVPTSAMGISTGGPGQPINVNLNVNGQILTPAQLEQLANLIAAQIKKGYSN